MSEARRPSPQIRHAVRVLEMVGELHKNGYQKLRVMPFMSPSGMHWRCWVGNEKFFFRNHGAILSEAATSGSDGEQSQAVLMIARYSSADDNHYFGWQDGEDDDARLLAEKFSTRFLKLARSGLGWNYNYAGWYERLLGLAERGWLPVVLSDDDPVLYDRIPLRNVGASEGQSRDNLPPLLPAPPRGKLQQDYPGG